MEGGDVLPQMSIESYTTPECISSDGVVYTQRIGENDSQLPNVLSCGCFLPPYNQLAHHNVLANPHPSREQCHWSSATGLTVLSPWHVSGATIQDTLTPDVSGGNPGDVFGGVLGLLDDQIWVNGPRPGRLRFASQEDSFRGTNIPFNQGNGNDVQLCDPSLYCTTSDGQSPHASSQQLEVIPDSPFEHHRPDERAETPESSGFQRIPQTQTARGSRTRPIGSKEWPCGHDGCNKSYGRPQDVKRHAREKHVILPQCLICGIKWTRAEKIRRHLIKRHRGHFTKKERQQIRHLQGLNNTIDFLNEWETRRL